MEYCSKKTEKEEQIFVEIKKLKQKHSFNHKISLVKSYQHAKEKENLIQFQIEIQEEI